ncbi:hypothetical protein FQR65_LT04713 [Abscondita terminalis]|nr:hypothetical protein FQR65_LT04713 [Abscondita terminalis]
MKVVACYLIFPIVLVFGLQENCSEIKPAWKRLIEPYHTECICATGVQMDLANNLLENFVYANNPCLKCYITCLHRKIGLIRYDNTIDIDTLTTVAAGITYDIAKKCNEEVLNVTDPCIVSYEMSVCVTNIIDKICSVGQ